MQNMPDIVVNNMSHRNLGSGEELGEQWLLEMVTFCALRLVRVGCISAQVVFWNDRIQAPFCVTCKGRSGRPKLGVTWHL